MHEIAWWVFIGALAWTAFFGIVVLALLGVHRDDDDWDGWQ